MDLKDGSAVFQFINHFLCWSDEYGASPHMGFEPFVGDKGVEVGVTSVTERMNR